VTVTREKTDISCKTLLSLLISTTDLKIRKILIRDFVTKVKQLERQAASDYAFKLLWELNTAEEKKLCEELKMQEKPKSKPYVDVAFVMIKLPELLAAKVALDIDPAKMEDKMLRNYPFWDSKIECNWQDEQLNVVLTYVGEDRGVYCANACSALFESYDVGLCILVGMAAGDKAKCQLGDTIASTLVINYEAGRIEKDGFKPRPDPSIVSRGISRLLKQYDYRVFKWHDFFFDKLKNLAELVDIPDLDKDWLPKFDIEVSLTGDKVRVDEPFEEMQKQYHEKGRIIEMESSGFSKTCEDYEIPWLIFRGISDYAEPKSKEGDEEKGEPKDIWQPIASLSAATAAINFLQNSYRIDQEKTF
jgi:nucleoside phosphorylase